MTIFVPTARAVKTDLAREKLRHYVELTTGLRLHRWQVDLCEILERFLHEQGLLIAIHAAPQIGKSLVLSQRLPAWLLGHAPMRREVLAAYNQDKATEFAGAVRETMRSAAHQDVFPDPAGFVVDPSSEGRFKTQARHELNQAQYSLRAIGLQTGFTGSGADDLFMDDPYASPEDARSEAINGRTCRFYGQTAKPRLSATANVGLMFHRYHPTDIAGQMLATGKWEEVRLPAHADDQGNDPTRAWRGLGELVSPLLDPARVEEIREDDPETYWGQYQGLPRSPAGGLFTEAMFEIVEEEPPLDLWMRCFDPASSEKQNNDSTASARVGIDADGSLVIADVTRWKRAWPQTRDGVWSGKPYAPGSVCTQDGILQTIRKDAERLRVQAEAMQLARPATYLVGFAKKGMGLPMVQDLQDNDEFLTVPLFPLDERGDKKQRASVWATKGYTRRIRLVRGEWNSGFVRRCLDFRGDGTSPDDEQDAVSLTMILLHQYRGKTLEQAKSPQPGTVEYHERLVALNGW